jgi:hypothetical protein
LINGLGGLRLANRLRYCRLINRLRLIERLRSLRLTHRLPARIRKQFAQFLPLTAALADSEIVRR